MQQYTSITVSGICPFFGAAQACFYLRLRSKTYRFGHTPVEGRSDGTRGKPQNSPCAAPEGQQKTSKTSIQSKAVPTFHALRIGWCARFQSSSPCSIIHGGTEEFKNATLCQMSRGRNTTTLLYYDVVDLVKKWLHVVRSLPRTSRLQI